MKVDVTTLDAKKSGTLDLPEAIFGLPARPDLLERVVVWQLAKRRAGTHKVKGRSEVSGTGTKMYRQKGTGRARHGTSKVNIFRGGGRAFGPVVRSHAIDLPKKVRKLALKTALSAKQASGKLIVVDTADVADAKTKAFAEKLAKLGVTSALIVDGSQVNDNILRAARNIPHVDVLPSQGANVYDILRHEVLMLTKAAVEDLEARLS